MNGRTKELAKDWPPFSLLETMRCDSTRLPNPAIHLLDKHIERLRRSAEFFRDATRGTRFSYVPSHEQLARAIMDAVENLATVSEKKAARFKIRLLVDVHGAIEVQVAELSSNAKPMVELAFDSEPTPSDSPFVRHKTTNRTLYDEARKRAGCPPLATAHHYRTDGPDDVVMYNERGQVTETSICNLAIEMPDGRWLTPSVDCGLLRGTERARMLESGEMDMYEGEINVDELKAALKLGCRIRVFNSVRGPLDARII